MLLDPFTMFKSHKVLPFKLFILAFKEYNLIAKVDYNLRVQKIFLRRAKMEGLL